ncbi:putative potassium transport system protein kup 1 [Candidatus Filomicrobium marinum]|uniref:Probable potassium transport system protein Kup n=1 Tax=Candidatus Filomicrobium marinum TaxID=1608628 RepID=A0A0D6JB34_9HYPH|nr:potassium transporter Kup [Candidatus Filomicrobium marinum]CFX03456.1 putative potassium transport system protein kup 1 [Candidatus Filomicrobium marinum]CPR15854.1 putative potassium transport system protein kup 1 [Candidatus Filomicrobium marinum]
MTSLSARISASQRTDRDLRSWQLGFGAIGIVYGDIGTSPLYAFREALKESPPGEATILGLLSLIFWALTLIVSLKYLIIILRADNHGEGGILALVALLMHSRPEKDRIGLLIVALGILGAALLYGDGAITPAISVLSAVEGLATTGHGLEFMVLPTSVVILVLLFALQKRGTYRLASWFAPIMFVWFVMIAILGVTSIVQTPHVLAALDPRYALAFLFTNGVIGFIVLGAVFLVVTGAEALYADMGHFGARPIRLAWFAIAGPCLLLNYFGQGAAVLADPGRAPDPFYALAPTWGLYPLIGLATLATIVASQAMISGVFSLTSQAVQLGFMPRIRIVHTSSSESGQIYVPLVNGVLGVATVLLAIGFGSSSHLAAAYGIAVSTTMVITTILLFFVMRDCWRIQAPVAFAVTAFFMVVDLVFFGANLLKVEQGGWLPLAIAAALFVVMVSWRRGRQHLFTRLGVDEEPIKDFVARADKQGLHRIPGTAVFLSPLQVDTPYLLRRLADRTGVLRENVLIVTVLTTDLPRVPAAQRLTMREIAPGFYRVLVHYGFMQTPHVPVALRLAQEAGYNIDVEDAVFFLGRVTLVPAEKVAGMPMWMKKLFSLMSHNAQTAADFYNLPPDQVIELGIQLEI